MPTERVAGALFHRPEILADAGPEQEEPSATRELLELLAWACENQVISAADCAPAALPGRRGRPGRDPQPRPRLRRPAQQQGVQPGRTAGRGVRGGRPSPRLAQLRALAAAVPRSSAMTNERNRDRSHLTTHRRLEVVKPMTNTQDDGERRTPEKIAELFAIAARSRRSSSSPAASPSCTKSRPPR